MQYLFIFFLVASISVGVLTYILALAVFFRKKTPLERLFLAFFSFFTARMLSDSIVFYLFPLLPPASLILYLVMLVGRVTLAGSLLFFILFIHRLTGIFQSKKSLIAVLAIFGASFLFYIGEYLLRHSFPSVEDFYAFSPENFMIILLMIYPIAVFLVFSRRVKNMTLFRLIRRFMILLLLIFPLIVIEDLLSPIGFFTGASGAQAELKLFPLYYLLFYFFLLYHGFRHVVLERRALHAPHAIRDDFVKRFGITEREREIISLMIEGASNKEIGEKLFISTATVRNHLHNIFEKTGAQNRVALLRMCTG